MVKITMKKGDNPTTQLDPFHRIIFGKVFNVAWRYPQNANIEINFSPCGIFEQMENTIEGRNEEDPREDKEDEEAGDHPADKVQPRQGVVRVPLTNQDLDQEQQARVTDVPNDIQEKQEENLEVKDAAFDEVIKDDTSKADDEISEHVEGEITESKEDTAQVEGGDPGEEMNADCLISNAHAITKIKSRSDFVTPPFSLYFFKTSFEDANEMRSSQQTVARALELVIEHIPVNSRDAHFKTNDLWQGIPKLMNQEFNTNLMNADSARMYELLMVVSDALFPDHRGKNNGSQITYDTCVLCSPGSGVVSGLKMFVDLTQPHINLNLKAFTRHPWKERSTLDDVISDDTIMFWRKSSWKFVLNDEMSIDTKEEVIRIVDSIKTSFPNKLNLLVADLSCCDKISSCATQLQLAEQTNRALVTEAGQLEVALSSLRNGGNLILSLVNSVEPKSTIGNIRLLVGLFANVWIIPTRPSSTWNRPIMLVCCGYVGENTFSCHYSDFSKYYLDSVKENLKEDKKVFLSLAFYPEKIQSKMAKVCDFIAKETRERTQTLIMNFLEGPEANVTNLQTETADKWLEMISRNVDHAQRDWGVFIRNVHQATSIEELQLIRQLWSEELPIRIDKVNLVLGRLDQTYVKDEKPVTFLNVMAKPVRIHTIGRMMQNEKLPSRIAFSRFSSPVKMYDRMVVRAIGSQCPKKKSLMKLKTQACTNHNTVDVIASLSNDGFVFETDEEHLLIACACLSPGDQLLSNEMDIHHHVVSAVIKELCALQRDDNYYVCKYPLWTRLQISVFCILKSCFKEARLVISKRICGVLFIKFHGQNETEVEAAFSRLRRIPKQLLEDRPVNMELVPITSIMTCFDLFELATYNNYLIHSEISSMLKTLESV